MPRILWLTLACFLAEVALQILCTVFMSWKWKYDCDNLFRCTWIAAWVYAGLQAVGTLLVYDTVVCGPPSRTTKHHSTGRAAALRCASPTQPPPPSAKAMKAV